MNAEQQGKNTNTWDILTRVWALHRAIHAKAAQGLETLGLSTFEPLLLYKIREHKYPSEVVKLTRIPAPTVSHILRRLEKEGLLQRTLDSKDFRKHAFTLTPEGENKLTQSQEHFKAALEHMLTPLSPEEKITFAALLSKMLEGEV